MKVRAGSGMAVAMAGFVLGNPVLIIGGALVGASGAILTKLMADAMNRSVMNIMLGGFGGGDTTSAVGGPGGGSERDHQRHNRRRTDRIVRGERNDDEWHPEQQDSRERHRNRGQHHAAGHAEPVTRARTGSPLPERW